MGTALLLASCTFLLTVISTEGEHKVVVTELERYRAQRKTAVEVTCVLHYKDYCKSHSPGFHFSDGCRECKCDFDGPKCKKGPCIYLPPYKIKPEDYCADVHNKNKGRSQAPHVRHVMGIKTADDVMDVKTADDAMDVKTADRLQAVNNGEKIDDRALRNSTNSAILLTENVKEEKGTVELSRSNENKESAGETNQNVTDKGNSQESNAQKLSEPSTTYNILKSATVPLVADENNPHLGFKINPDYPPGVNPFIPHRHEQSFSSSALPRSMPQLISSPQQLNTASGAPKGSPNGRSVFFIGPEVSMLNDQNLASNIQQLPSPRKDVPMKSNQPQLPGILLPDPVRGADFVRMFHQLPPPRTDRPSYHMNKAMERFNDRPPHSRFEFLTKLKEVLQRTFRKPQYNDWNEGFRYNRQHFFPRQHFWPHHHRRFRFAPQPRFPAGYDDERYFLRNIGDTYMPHHETRHPLFHVPTYHHMMNEPRQDINGLYQLPLDRFMTPVRKQQKVCCPSSDASTNNKMIKESATTVNTAITEAVDQKRPHDFPDESHASSPTYLFMARVINVEPTGKSISTPHWTKNEENDLAVGATSYVAHTDEVNKLVPLDEVVWNQNQELLKAIKSLKKDMAHCQTYRKRLRAALTKHIALSAATIPYKVNGLQYIMLVITVALTSVVLL